MLLRAYLHIQQTFTIPAFIWLAIFLFSYNASSDACRKLGGVLTKLLLYMIRCILKFHNIMICASTFCHSLCCMCRSPGLDDFLHEKKHKFCLVVFGYSAWSFTLCGVIFIYWADWNFFLITETRVKFLHVNYFFNFIARSSI